MLELQPRVQRRRRSGEQVPATSQLGPVVGVAPIGRAAPGRHQPRRPQLPEVIGDQALPLAGRSRELADAAITARQRAEQRPAQRVADELEEPRRRDLCRLGNHPGDNTSI